MDKKILIGTIVALVLLAGIVFVSAHFASDATEEEKTQPSFCGVSPPRCGAGACNFDCGGNCGVPSCGCR